MVVSGFKNISTDLEPPPPSALSKKPREVFLGVLSPILGAMTSNLLFPKRADFQTRTRGFSILVQAARERRREWEILAVNDLGEDCYTTPAITGGRIYIRTRSSLYSF